MNQIRGYENLDLLKETINDKFDSYMDMYYRMQDQQSKKTLYYRIMYDFTNDKYYLVKLQESMYKDSAFYSDIDVEMYGYINFLLIDDNYKKTIIKDTNEINNNAIYLISNNDRKLKTELINGGIKEKDTYMFSSKMLDSRKEKYFNENFININSDIKTINDNINKNSFIKIEEIVNTELLSNILKKCKPTIMIDITINNIFDIYDCIREYLEYYDLYVRHYKYDNKESILYLIPRRI